MKLSHVLECLASGELANLNLAEDRMNIKDNHKVVVMRSINAGLRDLHTKFMLKKNIIDVPLVIGEDMVTILSEDFVEVMNVYVDGARLKDHTYTLMDVNKIRLKVVLGLLSTVSVEYKASHRELTELDIMMDAEVNLPYSHLNALLYFVASRLYTGTVNQLDGDLNEGAVYAAKYRDEILSLSNQGIDVEELQEINTFNSKGFK